jgi:hypothetical protein
VSSCGEKLVAEAGVREPRGRETSSVGSRYRATAIKDVTVDTSVCVIVSCEL